MVKAAIHLVPLGNESLPQIARFILTWGVLENAGSPATPPPPDLLHQNPHIDNISRALDAQP